MSLCCQSEANHYAPQTTARVGTKQHFCSANMHRCIEKYEELLIQICVKIYQTLLYLNWKVKPLSLRNQLAGNVSQCDEVRGLHGQLHV